jgi:valyl-tRNA synthetase
LTADCNRFLEAYSFGALASALHSFFIYEVPTPSLLPPSLLQLCDVYLELIKPVVGYATATATCSESEEKERAEVKRLAQMTLYTCLEQYLRLAHPLMPFVTEELWQRLPQRSVMRRSPQLFSSPIDREALDPTASIMLSQYPSHEAEWFAPDQEEDMTVITSMIHAASSLRSHYRIANHVKPTFYYRTNTPAIVRALTAQAMDFCTLGRGQSLERLESENIPAGWCVKVISESLSLLLNLDGVIDCQEEMRRLEKEVQRCSCSALPPPLPPSLSPTDSLLKSSNIAKRSLWLATKKR